MMAMQLVTEENNAAGAELGGRELEASVLNKAAALLEEAVGHWSEDRNHDLMDNALKYNQFLWSVFQAELLDEANPLPAELRQNILSLSAFVDKRTFEVMAYPAPEKLEILIKINRDIAEGLMAH